MPSFSAERAIDSGRHIARSTLERLAPRALVRIRARRSLAHGEAELHLVPLLCDPRKASLDIGGNIGVYAEWMRRHSRMVHAFEPNPDLARLLRRSFGADVTVHQCALSDREGAADLHVPQVDGMDARGLASLEQAAPGNGAAIIPVKARPLDSFEFDPVGFVKIDVEGHELAVLGGGERLIERDRPIVLIEAEDRHRSGAVASARRFFEDRGYRGAFLWKGALRPVAEFTVEAHQDVANLDPVRARIAYANNFLYFPGIEPLERVRNALPPALRRLAGP